MNYDLGRIYRDSLKFWIWASTDIFYVIFYHLLRGSNYTKTQIKSNDIAHYDAFDLGSILLDLHVYHGLLFTRPS